ncbi:MAG TPA: CinA family nicotinamide mononucleotide deamidase-related protein [candidate division Zixibacteria bacterium]|nr:CinA family nicotinamide mononucleotide deamidase-related protein [candidate division Zixibacteria bacterium]
MPSAEIIAIGTELLLGQIVDTNSPWMAQRLAALGVDLFFKSVVGDNPSRMREVIERALERSDIVITSGGLGPTQDDLTREVVAEATGRPLLFDERLLAQVEAHFRRRGRTMTPNNRRQAYIPQGALPVANPNGTAPSFIVEDPRAVIFALPGVPVELRWLFENEVEPYLRKRFNLAEVIHSRVLKVGGVGESAVDDKIGHLIAHSRNPTVGVLALPGQVEVRIAAKAADRSKAMELIAPLEAEVRGLLGSAVFAADEETMEFVVGKWLRERNKSVAVYEDLTLGQLAERVQNASPPHFRGAVIGSGDFSAPVSLLGEEHVPAGGMRKTPAELADELARRIRACAGSDLGLALHGHADPEGEIQNMGKGETCVCLTDGRNFLRRSFSIAGRGAYDRTRLTLGAMDLLRCALAEGRI